MPDLRLVITSHSGVNADGFIADVLDGNDGKVFSEKYYYGYNASWDRAFADEKQPFKDDIIQGICDKYGVQSENVIYQEGRNVFKEGLESKNLIRKDKQSERESVDVEDSNGKQPGIEPSI